MVSNYPGTLNRRKAALNHSSKNGLIIDPWTNVGIKKLNIFRNVKRNGTEKPNFRKQKV